MDIPIGPNPSRRTNKQSDSKISNHNSIVLSKPQLELRCVVVIPAFAESSLLPTLVSLSDTHHQTNEIEVLVIINESDLVSEEIKKVNRHCYQELQSFKTRNLIIHTIYVKKIPQNIAGVGMARKIGMDEAARRLRSVKSNDDSLIVNLDADCTVSSDYFESIFLFFRTHPNIELACIHFEHSIEECEDEEERSAIIKYELHLRYFIGMQRHIGLPFAYQTIGSAFAMRSDAYVSIGGMNKRKAGEDFYFIHKFSKKGTVGNLNNCTVYPSSRESFRVPFGTGRAVTEIINGEDVYVTYHPQSILDILCFTSSIRQLYESDDLSFIEEWPLPLRTYLESQNFVIIAHKLKSNVRSLKTFEKAIFQWFDAFQLMKYLHYCRDNYYDNKPVSDAIYTQKEVFAIEEDMDEYRLLQHLRCKDKRLDNC